MRTHLLEDDREALALAIRRLERRSFATRLAAIAEKPVGMVAGALPAGTSVALARLTGRALERALEIALKSLGDARLGGGRRMHSALASASGAIGGAFGFAALAIELPVSTMIMLRAIAAIAREEGEDLADPGTGLACLEVFALGGAPEEAAGVESGYFAVRGLLAEALTGAAERLAGQGTAGGAGALARFLALVSSRFGVVVSEKALAQAAAIVGAFGGAAVNLAFVEHFQELAQGHFTVRRLERIYGPEAVRAEYDLLKSETAAAL